MSIFIGLFRLICCLDMWQGLEVRSTTRTLNPYFYLDDFWSTLNVSIGLNNCAHTAPYLKY